MVAVRERCCERMTLQVVAHLTSDAPRRLDVSRQCASSARSRQASTPSAACRDMRIRATPAVEIGTVEALDAGGVIKEAI
jgi:hypothetical protein